METSEGFGQRLAHRLRADAIVTRVLRTPEMAVTETSMRQSCAGFEPSDPAGRRLSRRFDASRFSQPQILGGWPADAGV